jgi:hypothetical protein
MTNYLQVKAGAGLIAALSNDSNRRAAFVESQVKSKFERMLHPPLTYLGDAFQYRAVDGKFNSAMNPHLGQAGAPYAKTVRVSSLSMVLAFVGGLDLMSQVIDFSLSFVFPSSLSRYTDS